MRHWMLLFAFSIFETWLGRTKKIVANSSWELLAWGMKRCFQGVKWLFRRS